jgi:iron uptake system component EfeO
MKKFLVGLMAGLLVVGCALSGCGGDSKEVSGATVDDRPEIQRYRTYLANHGTVLTHATARLQEAVAKGELNWATPWYGIARVHFSSIEAAALGDRPLYRRLESGAGELGGPVARFHLVERTLFRSESTAHLKGPLRLLRRDVATLNRYLRTAPIEPMVLLDQARQLMHVVATTKMNGQWERFSPLDMVDVSADVEGIESAVSVAYPCLGTIWEKRIEARFVALYEVLMEFGFTAREAHPPSFEAGASMRRLSDQTKAEAAALRSHLQTVARVLDQADRTAPPRCP